MLIDDAIIRLRTIESRQGSAGVERRTPFYQALQHAVVFRVDAVADYVDATVKEEDATIVIRDVYPTIAPLAPVMWFEYAFRGEQHGFCLAYSDSDQPEWPNERWWAVGQVFIRAARGVQFAEFLHGLFIDETGGCLGYVPYHIDPSQINEQVPPEWVDSQYFVLNTALCALTFAHCKGVTISEHQQPRQQRRAAEREGRPPLVTFKTIDIAPATRILHEEGNITQNGLKRALHITRGHFAHYSEEKPLFGKYVGTVFRPMHLRGSLARGLVLKDYNVKAEQQQ